MERQLSTSLVGPMNVTRAVLPVMRKQRSGLIITISSTAGLIGFEFGTAYAASKFGLEGWMQSLQAKSSRLASIPSLSIRASSALSFSPRSQQISPRRPSRTTTSAERSKWNSGEATTVSSPAIRQARPGTDNNLQSGEAAAALHRRRRCRRHGRAGGGNASAADRRLSRAVIVPRLRRRCMNTSPFVSHGAMTDVTSRLHSLSRGQ